MKSRRIQIFKAGSHSCGNGTCLDFKPTDLAMIAAAYDPTVSEAPIVIGHPGLDAPAYGWVKKLIAANDHLEAEIEQMDDGFADMVRQGRYKKVSASFYLPQSPQNPKPGGYYLRHVGFLGAHPPAIKGLRAVSFSEEGDLIAALLPFDPTDDHPDQRQNSKGDQPVVSSEASSARNQQDKKDRPMEAGHLTKGQESESSSADPLQSKVLLDGFDDAALPHEGKEAEVLVPSIPLPHFLKRTGKDALGKGIEKRRDKRAHQTDDPAAHQWMPASFDQGGRLSDQMSLMEENAQLQSAIVSLKGQIDWLQRENQAAMQQKRAAQAVSFAERLIEEGRILPIHQSSVVSILCAIDDHLTIDFNEKTHVPLISVFKEMLESLPSTGPIKGNFAPVSAFADYGEGLGQSHRSSAMTERWMNEGNIDVERLYQHQQIVALCEAESIDYETAAKRIHTRRI